LDLYAALNLEQRSSQEPLCIAFTGSGGKTSAMFHLARAMANRHFKQVLITTTTHLALAESGFADHQLTCSTVDRLRRKDLLQKPGIVLVCGPETADQKLAGLDSETIRRLRDLAVEMGIPLLIEADGSRRRPLKAPAEHEPVVPEFVDLGIVVVGLSGLGMRLDERSVHRSVIFAALCESDIGETITPDKVVKVMSSPFGGLKGISGRPERVVILNQVDTQPVLKGAREIAFGLLPYYDKVLMSELGSEREEVRAVYEPVAGIILAAGAASRFNGTKQLASWRGQPLVQHVVRAGLAGKFHPLRVVIGYDRENLKAALEGMDAFHQQKFSLVENPGWMLGQSTSVRVGLDGLPNKTGAAVFMLADQPLVPAQILEVLQDVRAFRRPWVVAPTYHARRANPVLFGRELFTQLAQLQGDQGGRALLQNASFPVSWVPWDDPGLAMDIDTWEDYQSMNELDSV
jgi:molybdenum cofactor cytidylyltransferase